MSTSRSRFVRQSAEVFAARDPVTKVSNSEIKFLQQKALSLAEKKARILLHAEPKQLLHEMLITHVRGAYIQPHVNKYSAKSFLVLSGEMAVVLFDDEGSIETHHRLNSVNTEGDFMIRLEAPVYHTIVVLTDTVVFLETVLGPHEETLYAKFAPKPNQLKAAQQYLGCLEKRTRLS